MQIYRTVFKKSQFLSWYTHRTLYASVQCGKKLLAELFSSNKCTSSLQCIEIFVTENIDVSTVKRISVNVARITLDHLQVTRTVRAVLTCIRQNQLCPIIRQMHLLWHVVC